jgi:serine/threonine protein kinase
VDVAIREPIAGRYRLREKLGGGGMAEVYDAVDVRLDRPVAVKVLRDGLLSTPGMVERAEAEALLAARIHHPNVVAVLDAGRIGDTPFVVMERLPGLTLRDRLRDAPLDDDEIRSIGTQMLHGLAAAHELGVVHRDIKPSNVLAGPRDTWKIADFGIATWLAAETTLSGTGEIIGSAPYLAPERVDGKSATAASDVYSVGVVLFEVATGRRPVEGKDALATVMAIREGRAEPLSSFRPNLDPALSGAIERALAVDPADRWPSATAFAEALERSRGAGATERRGRVTDGDPSATQPLPPVAATSVLPAAAAPPGVSVSVPDDSPRSAGGDAESTARGAVAPEPPATRRPARHARPSRALGIVLGAAVALLLAIALTTFVLVRGDTTEGAPARTIDPAAPVPDDLRSSMDDLAEAIAP